MPEIEHLKGKIGEGDFEKLRDVLYRNADVFSKHKADIGCCNFVEHEIELEVGAVPHREGARRMTPHKSEACRAEIEMLLEYDKIEPSKSPWACGVVMAKKKGGQLRFCCDFRYLNAVTIKDAYPIPRIDESLSKLGDAKFFTTLDLGSAFWQVPLRKKDREKTGFACELGLYQWKRMPFGLCNATATFQRLMAQALTGVTKKYGNLLMCYVDDVFIATPTLEDHIDWLDEVFGCMKRAGLKCKPSKCEILRDSIKYLGRMVDRHGVRPDPEAVEAVLTWKAPRTDTQLMSFLGFANYYREFIKGYADKVYPMQKLMRNKGKKFEWNDEAQVAFENIKRELCEAPVLGMPTEKGMYVLDTDASVVAISGILHQEQEWNGRTVLRPIAYGSKVLSDTEMKYGAPKAEMFAVVTFVEKYRAYLGSAPFKLRVDNRALSWLKTYSMDQSYIGRWIVRLDGYHMIIEHRMRDKHQNADSLSKKTEFYERLEQKQANQAEIKEGFSFLDKETYEALPLTRWLDNSGHPIPGHPELPVEKAAEIKILSKEDPLPLDLLLRSNLVQQELSRMNINSLSLLDKMVQVTPQVMRMLGGLLEREVTRDDPEWTAAVASLTVSEKVKIMPSRRQHEENERDCRTIVQQLVSSIPQEILTSTSYRQKEQGSSKRKKTVTFVDRDKEGEVVEQNLLQDYLSGEKDEEKNQRSQDQHPGQVNLSGESEIDEKIPDEKQDLENKVLSGEFRWMRRKYRHDLEESAVSSTTSWTDDDSRNSGMDTYSDRNSTSGSELSELAIHTLLVETRARDLDREVYQDPDSDRYLIQSERVFDNAADDLETIAVSKRSISLLPQKEAVRTDLQPFQQETQPLAKIWCVKMEEDTHQPNELNSQMRIMKTYLKARYRLSDLLRAQRNDRMTSNLKRWIENGAPDKGDLEKDSYRILRQYFMQKEGRLYLNKDGIVACRRREEDKVLYKYNAIVLPQLYQTELLFRSHDQMGHQGIDKVYQRILKRFEWPGMKKACEKWVTACLSCQQVKDPRKLRFPLQSIESSEFNEVVQIDHQKICMTDSGYNQVLVMIDNFTKYAEAVPCMTASAEETCDHLINTWIARHGCPMTFQSDNGTAFVGELTKELMRRSQVAQAHSTTYHPQTNGLVIPARDIPRGQSPMELLTPREMSQTTEIRLPAEAETNRVTIPDPSDTLGDPVVEQTVRKLIETAGRLVANKNASGSGVTAPYGTIDDTGRVQLSQTVIRQGISNVTPLMGSSRIPERKVRKMPAKKVSRVIDVQKNNQLKYNFTGVPETDPRACFNRATWSPAVNLQQPPLGTSHLILGDSLVRVLSNLRTSWVTTVMAFGGATIAQLYRMVELMNPGKIPNVMILVGTNDISRGSDEQEALWESMMVFLFTTLWQKFSCAVLIVCTVPMNTRSLTASGRRHNEGVMRWNNILRNLANRNAGRMILMDIEHELRAMDQVRLTTDGIHFDSIEGQAWLNRVFQERLEELEAELFDTGVLKEEGTLSDAVITTFVPPNLETRLGTVPAVTNYRQQSSSEPGRRTDVQDRLGEAPMRRTIHPRRRIGPVNQPIEEVAGASRSDTRSETTSTSREERPSRGSLLWSRSISSPWHIYKDELMKLDLKRVSFIEDARRMLNGAMLSVNKLYSITGVDWLIAASINFSSTTALRFADLEGLPSNNTMGPVNARPLQDVRLNHDEENHEERPGRFLTARAPIGQHVKIFRQLTTPPGHVKERVYPKLVNQDGDAQRYGGLTAIKKDETIFAAYDKAEMRKAKIMVVANSEFVYTSKSLFWPDVIMLAAVDLDLLQSVSLAIGVQRQTEMNPITIVFAGINDHLHSRGFLSRLRYPATAENTV